MSKRKFVNADNLGLDDPKYVRLRAYSVSMFEAQKTMLQCCQSLWCQKWDWSEYFVKFDTAFCFPCRNFKSQAGRYF